LKPLHHGIELFNRGEYFEAHEALEDAWREGPADEKKFLQGLVQAAVGLHHFSRGNLVGARGVLARSVRNLEPFAPAHKSIDLDLLLESLRAWLACARDGASPPARPHIHFVNSR
jgi:predicted metal-dependent hydrolase